MRKIIAINLIFMFVFSVPVSAEQRDTLRINAVTDQSHTVVSEQIVAQPSAKELAVKALPVIGIVTIAFLLPQLENMLSDGTVDIHALTSFFSRDAELASAVREAALQNADKFPHVAELVSGTGIGLVLGTVSENDDAKEVSVDVTVGSAFMEYTDGKTNFTYKASSLGGLLDKLAQSSDKFRRPASVFVNGINVMSEDQCAIKLKKGDEIYIVPDAYDIIQHVAKKAGIATDEKPLRVEYAKDTTGQFPALMVNEYTYNPLVAFGGGFEVVLDDIAKNDIMFDCRFEDGVVRKVSLYELLVYGMVAHEIKLNRSDDVVSGRKRANVGHYYGNVDNIMFDPQQGISVGFEKSAAQAPLRRYRDMTKAAVLWYLDNYCSNMLYSLNWYGDNKEFARQLDWYIRQLSLNDRTVPNVFPTFFEYMTPDGWKKFDELPEGFDLDTARYRVDEDAYVWARTMVLEINKMYFVSRPGVKPVDKSELTARLEVDDADGASFAGEANAVQTAPDGQAQAERLLVVNKPYEGRLEVCTVLAEDDVGAFSFVMRQKDDPQLYDALLNKSPVNESVLRKDTASLLRAEYLGAFARVIKGRPTREVSSKTGVTALQRAPVNLSVSLRAADILQPNSSLTQEMFSDMQEALQAKEGTVVSLIVRAKDEEEREHLIKMGIPADNIIEGDSAIGGVELKLNIMRRRFSNPSVRFQEDVVELPMFIGNGEVVNWYRAIDVVVEDLNVLNIDDGQAVTAAQIKAVFNHSETIYVGFKPTKTLRERQRLYELLAKPM